MRYACGFGARVYGTGMLREATAVQISIVGEGAAGKDAAWDALDRVAQHAGVGRDPTGKRGGKVSSFPRISSA